MDEQSTLSQTYSDQAKQYTGDIRKAVKENTGMDNPAAFRAMAAEQTFEQDQPLQESIEGQTSAAKMAELAAYDQSLAQQSQQANQQQAAFDAQQRQAETQMGYIDPSSAQATIDLGPSDFDTSIQRPSSEGAAFLSPFAAEAVSAGQSGSALDAFDLASQARASREKYLGSEVDALVDLYKYQLAQEQEQEDDVYARYEDERDYAKLYGGEVVNPLTGQIEVYEAPTEEGAYTQPEQNQVTAQIWDNLVNNAKTEYDVWKAIDTNQDAWRAAGVNVDQLWQWHSNLAKRTGQGGVVAGKTGDGDGATGNYQDKISGSTAGERKDISDYTSFLQDAANNIQNMAEYQRQNLATGPVAKWVGILGSKEAKQDRSDLGTFADQVRQGLYGSAVSETEMKRGNLPDTFLQEPENERRLRSLFNKKVRELENRLLSTGMSDDEVIQFMVERGIMVPVRDKSSGETGVIEVTEFDPNTHERI